MLDKRPLVIFAEDDNDDWMLIDDTIQQCSSKCQIERVTDGVDLLKRLRDTSARLPDVVLMDLKMPKKDGIETLAEIRQDLKLKHIPVIMMTTSNTESDIVKSYTTGANSYVVKPVTFDAMRDVLVNLHHYWANVVVTPSNA